MKLMVNKDVILDGLQKVQSIVGSRTTLPILYNVFWRADKDQLTLTATDLEISVRTTVEAKITRTGGTTLPARRLYSILGALPVSEIEIDVDDKDVAAIRAGASFFKIIGISEEEFPALPKFQGQRSFVMDQGDLKRMLLGTHYAASNDESRAVLNGVLLSFRGEKLTVVATDGRRMAHYSVDLEFPRESEGDWVIPSKTVSELLKTLKEEGPLKIQVSENQIVFEFGTMLIYSKLIEGTYPNFRQVIPTSCEERISIERESLLNAVHRVSLLVSDKASPITLTFSKNHLEIKGIAQDIGEAEESLPIKYTGKEIAISFNPDFIIEPLKNLTSDEVALELTDELSPGVLKADTPFLYVLMPMRVR
jgi:DNA polymerase-3 subunit beta